MKNIKLKYILTILFAVFFVLIIWNFLNILSFTDSSFNFEGKSKKEKLYPNSQIIQKITAEKNNLNQINISISKFSADFREKIKLEVADENCEKTITESEINMLTWNSPNYKKFRFKAIPGSKDRTYCLKIIYIPFKKEQEKKAYISSHESKYSSYINTGKSIEEQKNRTLKLKPAYENDSVWKNFSQLINRMSQYKPAFFKSVLLGIIFIFSLILLIVLFLIMVRI